MANVGGLQWQIPPSVLANNVDNYAERLLDAVFGLAQLFQARLESFAKANAGWTDRTGNARQGLTSLAVKEATGVVLYLFHAATYGIWLEVKNAGRYAIILRTLEAHYQPFIAAIKQLIGGR